MVGSTWHYKLLGGGGGKLANITSLEGTHPVKSLV